MPSPYKTTASDRSKGFLENTLRLIFLFLDKLEPFLRIQLQENQSNEANSFPYPLFRANKLFAIYIQSNH